MSDMSPQEYEDQFKSRERFFDVLEKAVPSSNIWKTPIADDYFEAKRTIRQYLKQIMEVTL